MRVGRQVAEELRAYERTDKNEFHWLTRKATSRIKQDLDPFAVCNLAQIQAAHRVHRRPRSNAAEGTVLEEIDSVRADYHLSASDSKLGELVSDKPRRYEYQVSAVELRLDLLCHTVWNELMMTASNTSKLPQIQVLIEGVAIDEVKDP
jgi:hypothetical protein